MLAFDPKHYPTTPGCYLMRDASGCVVYVGKARNLRKRLTSHFRSVPATGRRTRLLGAVADVEVILVHNETEALILENNLIKLYQPRGNRVLLDADEGYFYIALTAEDLPRLVTYRKNRSNKDLERGGEHAPVARCFGPYVNRGYRDALLAYVVEHFRLRTCAPLAAQVCVRYHLSACGGVCEQRVSVADYARAVGEAAKFLSHGHAQLLRQLRRQMAQCAYRLEFERASRIKRHIELLERALEPQIVEREVRFDQDVVHFASETVLVLHIHSGILCGCSFSDLAGSSADTFLLERYATACPAELIVNQASDPRTMQQRLTHTTGHQVRITLTRGGRGLAQRLMTLAALNHANRTEGAGPTLNARVLGDQLVEVSRRRPPAASRLTGWSETWATAT